MVSSIRRLKKQILTSGKLDNYKLFSGLKKKSCIKGAKVSNNFLFLFIKLTFTRRHCKLVGFLKMLNLRKNIISNKILYQNICYKQKNIENFLIIRKSHRGHAKWGKMTKNKLFKKIGFMFHKKNANV